MKLKLKEEPKEWRKITALTCLALAVISSIMFWRHHLSRNAWLTVVAILAAIAAAAFTQPRWFRGYYRVSSYAGFYLSQFIGRIVLAGLFFLALTPLALILRLTGKDLLRLKKQPNAQTYWTSARKTTPLDRMF